jgi:hypothetical protein
MRIKWGSLRQCVLKGSEEPIWELATLMNEEGWAHWVRWDVCPGADDVEGNVEDIRLSVYH